MTRRQGDTGDGLTQGWSFQNWNYDRPTQLPDPLLEMLAHLKMYLTHTSYMGRKKWNHLIGKLFWTRDTTLRTYSTESWWINDCSNKVKWIVDFRRFWIFNNNKKPPLGPDRLFWHLHYVLPSKTFHINNRHNSRYLRKSKSSFYLIFRFSPPGFFVL